MFLLSFRALQRLLVSYAISNVLRVVVVVVLPPSDFSEDILMVDFGAHFYGHEGFRNACASKSTRKLFK